MGAKTRKTGLSERDVFDDLMSGRGKGSLDAKESVFDEFCGTLVSFV
jgi:hypothetical protein